MGGAHVCGATHYYPAPDNAQEVASVAVSHSGDSIAVALLSGAGIIHPGALSHTGAARPGRAAHMLLGHEDALTGIAWAPGDRRVATSSLDRTVRVWCAGTGRCLHVLMRAGRQVGRRLQVPQRCSGGTTFDVVVEGQKGTVGPGELVSPGSRPSIRPFPAGTRVFKVLVPKLPLIAIEHALATGGATVFDRPEGDAEGVWSWGGRARLGGVEVGCLEEGEAIILPPPPPPEGKLTLSGQAAAERARRWEQRGRLLLSQEIYYEAPYPIPHSWDRTLALYEMDQGIHLEKPRPLLGRPTVAAGPLTRDRRRVTLKVCARVCVFCLLFVTYPPIGPIKQFGCICTEFVGFLFAEREPRYAVCRVR